MYLISNLENLGSTIGITGLEVPIRSAKNGYLCNKCLLPIKIGDDIIKARSSKKKKYYYHLSCATAAVTTGKVKISKKRVRQILNQREYLRANPQSNLLIDKNLNAARAASPGEAGSWKEVE